MILVWRTDVHQSDRGPRSRLDDWAETVDGKLRQVAEIARQCGASAVLDGGDFFHNPIPSRSSHALVRRTADLHARHYPCRVIANVGNHDVRYGDLRYLPESPLGVLFAAGVFEPCHQGSGVWVEQGAVRARVVGIPFRQGGLDRERLASVRRESETHLVVLLHGAASPRGGTFPDGEEIVSYEELANLCPEASLFFIGHWHKDQGISRVGSSWVVNCGSLTRGSLGEDDLLRVPKVAVAQLDPDGTCRVRLQALEVAAPEAVFDLRGRDAQKSRAQSEERAVRLAHLFGQLYQPAGSVSLEDQVRGTDLPPGVRERVLDALARGRQKIGEFPARPE